MKNNKVFDLQAFRASLIEKQKQKEQDLQRNKETAYQHHMARHLQDVLIQAFTKVNLLPTTKEVLINAISGITHPTQLIYAIADHFEQEEENQKKQTAIKELKQEDLGDILTKIKTDVSLSENIRNAIYVLLSRDSQEYKVIDDIQTEAAIVKTWINPNGGFNYSRGDAGFSRSSNQYIKQLLTQLNPGFAVIDKFTRSQEVIPNDVFSPEEREFIGGLFEAINIDPMIIEKFNSNGVFRNDWDNRDGIEEGYDIFVLLAKVTKEFEILECADDGSFSHEHLQYLEILFKSRNPEFSVLEKVKSGEPLSEDEKDFITDMLMSSKETVPLRFKKIGKSSTEASPTIEN